MLFRKMHGKLSQILRNQAEHAALLNSLISKVNAMAHTLEDTLAAVTDEGTKEDSLIALVNGIELQLKDALAGTTLPPAIQAKVDAVFDGVTANATKVQAAINANSASGQPNP